MWLCTQWVLAVKGGGKLRWWESSTSLFFVYLRQTRVTATAGVHLNSDAVSLVEQESRGRRRRDRRRTKKKAKKRRVRRM